MSSCNTCPSKSSCGKTENVCGITNNPNNKVKQVIAVMSGKGGVGKSTVSVMLAKALSQAGHNVGILDADITGPSIPRLLKLSNRRAFAQGNQMIPVISDDGLKAMSVNFIMEDEAQPAVWRGPIISNMVKQFWTDVLWEDLDYLIIDMPPGTGDVALTVMQSIPINGIVMVSIPQDLVSMIVSKAVNMAKLIDIPVLGLVQNMSYMSCGSCGEKHRFFESEEIDDYLKKEGIKLLGELPMDKNISRLSSAKVSSDETLLFESFEPIMEEILASLKVHNDIKAKQNQAVVFARQAGLNTVSVKPERTAPSNA